MLYFLSVYSAPNATYIQVGASFHAYVQTDALQQGEADASHAFGHVLARLIADHLAPTIPTIAVTLIHDDTTFAGIPYLPPDSLTPSDPPPSAISATGTPLPYAIAYYAHLLTTLLRCKLASHKTKLLQTHCPSDHPASLARLLHLFPADTTIVADGHLILAGCPYGSPAGVRTALRHSHAKYEKTIARLHEIPAISAQVRVLVLTLSARPTSTFGLQLRVVPPSLTAGPSPDGTVPFAIALRHSLLAALATILSLQPDAILAAAPSTATFLQSLLPASIGGIHLPDPELLAPPAHLASVADTLPIHYADPALRAILGHPLQWSTSRSPNLADAWTSFHSIAPILVAASTADPDSLDDDDRAPDLALLLLDAAGAPTIEKLHAVAGRRVQYRFTRAVFGHLLSFALNNPASPLTASARARLRHAAAPLSHLIFTAYYIPPTSLLSDFEVQYLYCHRLGIPLPRAGQHLNL